MINWVSLWWKLHKSRDVIQKESPIALDVKKTNEVQAKSVEMTQFQWTSWNSLCRNVSLFRYHEMRAIEKKDESSHKDIKKTLHLARVSKFDCIFCTKKKHRKKIKQKKFIRTTFVQTAATFKRQSLSLRSAKAPFNWNGHSNMMELNYAIRCQVTIKVLGFLSHSTFEQTPHPIANLCKHTNQSGLLSQTN